MLTTKKYEYLLIEKVRIHPDIVNHRPLDLRKVEHYEKDILKNGLLEPLVVWEKKHDEYYLVGGFHRLSAIQNIRQVNPGYFDRVDVRVVAGDPDEIRALNLKLNADRVDTRITDFFDTVIYLNNVNWDKEKIAVFLDKSVSWVDDIIRYAPLVNEKLRQMLQEQKVSWEKAKTICRKVMEAEPGTEKEVMARQIESLEGKGKSEKPKKKPLTFKSAKKKVVKHLEQNPHTTFSLNGDGLLSLLLVLEGKHYEDIHLEYVKTKLPMLIN